MSYDHYHVECQCGWFGYFRELTNNHNNCPRCNAYRQWVTHKPFEIDEGSSDFYFIVILVTALLVVFMSTVYVLGNR